MHALDRDAAGPNSQVSYSLSAESEFVWVESDSGRMWARPALLDLSHDLQVAVVATDAGSPPRLVQLATLIVPSY